MAENAPIAFIRRRQRAELLPVAETIAGDGLFLAKFNAAMECDDQQKIASMMLEVRRRAKAIDPSITLAEGTRIIVILAELSGAFPPG